MSNSYSKILFSSSISISNENCDQHPLQKDEKDSHAIHPFINTFPTQEIYNPFESGWISDIVFVRKWCSWEWGGDGDLYEECVDKTSL